MVILKPHYFGLHTLPLPTLPTNDGSHSPNQTHNTSKISRCIAINIKLRCYRLQIVTRNFGTMCSYSFGTNVRQELKIDLRTLA
jgi:hypothetical protein